MSANQSDLSSPKYGYDFVVATTQASINATLKEFLAGLTEPVVTVCYVADDQGNPVEIPYDQLKKNANGSDPFTIPADTNAAADPDVHNLLRARFMMGFRAQLGLPPGLLPDQIPDIVTLGSDTAQVLYNLLCSQFTVVQLTPGGGYVPEPKWFSASQLPGHPWVFTSTVDLRLSTVSPTAYGKLPTAVQEAIKHPSISNAFSVQQLLFDLDNATLETVPIIDPKEAPPGSPLHTALQESFLGAYFAQLQKQGAPVLGATITYPSGSSSASSTLVLRDLNFEVSPLLDGNGQNIQNPTPAQLNLATLSYLCAADNDMLPAAVPFGWNWVEPSEEADYDGAVSINRRAFVNYLRPQLLVQSVEPNCYLPSVSVTYDWAHAQTNYSYSLTPGQTPTVTVPTTGDTLLTFHFDADASSHAQAFGGAMDLHPSYDMTVAFSGSTMTIVQHLVIYVNVTSLATSSGGNVVDLTRTDTYTIAVNQDGQLEATMVTGEVDHSQNPSVDSFLNFWTGVNNLISSIETWVRNFVPTRLTDVPLSFLQGFVFPGGRTFAFKDAAFSEYGDLTSHITYTDPS